jgi:hypothetical protein
MPEKLSIDINDWKTMIKEYVPLMSKEEREAVKQKTTFAKHVAEVKARELGNAVLPSSLELR